MDNHSVDVASSGRSFHFQVRGLTTGKASLVGDGFVGLTRSIATVGGRRTDEEVGVQVGRRRS